MMHKNNSRIQYEEQKEVLGRVGETEGKVAIKDWTQKNIEESREEDEGRYRIVADENSIYEYNIQCITEKRQRIVTKER